MYSSQPSYGSPDSQYYSAAPPAAAPQVAIHPGAITYTTSTSPDGSIVYHPFKAVAASYQTPSGVVSGIQWVPAESTRVMPQGAQPAANNFAEAWHRGQMSPMDQKALKDWQRAEEKRKKKEEKESAKLLQNRDRQRTISRGDPDSELRIARERDAATTRERRKSINQGASPYMGAAVPVPGYATSSYSSYSAHGSPAISPMSGPTAQAPGGPYSAASAGYVRDRKYSTGATTPGDLDRQFSSMDVAGHHHHDEYGVPGGQILGRPQKYSTPETTAERMRKVSGNMGPERYSPHIANKPYTSASALQQSSYSPETTYTTASGHRGPEPFPRSASPMPQAYVQPRSSSPMPGAFPQRSSSPMPGAYPPRAVSPMPVRANSGVYPPGHVLEGQPIPGHVPHAPPMHSRPTTPNITGFPPSGLVSFPQPTIPGGPTPRAFPEHAPGQAQGQAHQLAAPEGFSRPINAAQPFTPFETMRVQDMEEFLHNIPRMPAVLQAHDVFHEDWARLMDDVALAWSGRLPVPNLTNGRAPKRATLTADLIDLWNMSFFVRRGVEVVLYKGRERRSGSKAGAIDIPQHLYDEDSPSSSDSEEDSDSDDDAQGGYGLYSRQPAFAPGQGSMADVMQARQRRRQMREERKRQRREKKIRQKARARNKEYSLYLTCVRPPMPHGAQPIHGMVGHQTGPGGVSPAVGGMPQGYVVPGVHGSHGSHGSNYGY